jgi:hypothetical protein
MQIEDHASTVAGPLRPATRTGSPQTAKMALFETANDTVPPQNTHLPCCGNPRNWIAESQPTPLLLPPARQNLRIQHDSQLGF